MPVYPGALPDNISPLLYINMIAKVFDLAFGSESETSIFYVYFLRKS